MKKEKIVEMARKNWLATSTRRCNFERIQQVYADLWKNVMKIGTVKNWVLVKGMNELRALDPDNKRISFEVGIARDACAVAPYAMKYASVSPTKKEREIITMLTGFDFTPKSIKNFDGHDPEKSCDCEGIFLLEDRETAVVLDNPIERHMDADGTGLEWHREDGPAWVFADGSKSYWVEGINVPEWVVMTPADKMDLKKILALKNIDQRRIAVQKCGVKKFEEVGVIVDEAQWRTLYDFEKVMGRKAYYLKMVNPSNGQVHIEGVGNDRCTVQDARNFRSRDRHNHWNPLHIDGVEQPGGNPRQEQQGDFCFAAINLATELPEQKKSNRLGNNHGNPHTVNGGKIYVVNDELEYLVVEDDAAEIDHAEHNTSTLRSSVSKTWEAFQVLERDHLSGMTLTVAD